MRRAITKAAITACLALVGVNAANGGALAAAGLAVVLTYVMGRVDEREYRERRRGGWVDGR